MTAATKDKLSIDKMLADPDMPLSLKKQLLLQLLTNESSKGDEFIEAVLAGHTVKNGKAVYEDKIKELKELITSLEQGPIRSATFLRTIDAAHDGLKSQRRVEVLLTDGTPAISVVPEPDKVGALARGDTVLLDGQARAVLARQANVRHVGDEARLVRSVGDDTVEVELEHEGRALFFASALLMGQILHKEVEPGDQVVICGQ